MSRVFDRAVRLALAMIVAGGLGFGVRAASAASASSNACPNNPGGGQIPVSCSTNAECDAACQQYMGVPSGYCVKGCCTCLL